MQTGLPIDAATVGHRPVAAEAGRIGPNAVTRLAEAIACRVGPDVLGAVFREAGVIRHLETPPQAMVPEGDVAALHAALRRAVGASDAAVIGAEAGRRTGDYLLARRIPRGAQTLLRHLPRRLAAAILLRAIAKHAWTFAGSGRFSYRHDREGVELLVAGGPVCRDIAADGPVCHYYAATFERVFAAMLGPRTRVTETDCEAAGAKACRFRLTW